MKNNINTIKNDKNTSDFKLLSSTTNSVLAGTKGLRSNLREDHITD